MNEELYYIIKLFIHVYLYVSYIWPNGWTKLADIYDYDKPIGILGITWAKNNSKFFPSS